MEATGLSEKLAGAFDATLQQLVRLDDFGEAGTLHFEKVGFLWRRLAPLSSSAVSNSLTSFSCITIRKRINHSVPIHPWLAAAVASPPGAFGS